MTVLGTFCEQITFDFNLAFSDFYEVCSGQGGLPRFFLKKRPLLPENAFFLKQGPLDSYYSQKYFKYFWLAYSLLRRFKTMKPEDELILKVTKEIVLKYIEIGRLAISSFDEAFRGIYRTVEETVQTKKP